MLLSKKIPISYIFSKIWPDMIAVIIIISLVALEQNYLPEVQIKIPSALPGVLGTAISLILAFRTNQAYGRWWEARKVWGAIVNDSRSWARQVLTFIVAPQHEEAATQIKQTLIYQQIAWVYALGRSLRKQNPLQDMESLISGYSINQIKDSQNIPNEILLLQAQALKHARQEAWLDDYTYVQLDETLVKLCDSMGKCERIKNTVFPSVYSLLVHIFIFLFIILTALGASTPLDWVSGSIMVVVGIIYFLIEKSAIHMQDPFEDRPTDTPMTALARTIDINLRQMMRDENLPEKAQAEKFYLM